MVTIQKRQPERIKQKEHKVSKVEVEKPFWIDELKYNDTGMKALFRSIIVAIKNIKIPEQKDEVKIKNAIEIKNPVEAVTIKNPIEIKNPVKQIKENVEEKISALAELLKKTTFKVRFENPQKVQLVDRKGKPTNLNVKVSSGVGGGGYSSVNIKNKDDEQINPSTEDTLQDVLAKLQEVADNTDELELKADTINLNTDNIEAKLDILENDKATESKQDDIITAIDSQGSLNTLNTTTVTLTDADTAYKLPTNEQEGRRSIILYNASDTDMYYGDSSVTTSNGILLASGAEVSLDISTGLYAVCGEDAKVIRIMEMK